jgi:ribosomal-protein-alanine N-acetyltransferase
VIKLRGKSIFLRPPTAADFHQYVALMKISQPFFRGLVSPFKGRKQFNSYLQRCERDDFCGFLICRRADGAVVGVINLFNIVRHGVQNAITGYFVGAPYVRQGYATEALQLVLRFAFRRLRLHRVEASIQPHNAASIALVKRAGFVLEGYSRRLVKIAGKWRDHQRWAILAEDWRKTVPKRGPLRAGKVDSGKTSGIPSRAMFATACQRS